MRGRLRLAHQPTLLKFDSCAHAVLPTHCRSSENGRPCSQIALRPFRNGSVGMLNRRSRCSFKHSWLRCSVTSQCLVSMARGWFSHKNATYDARRRSGDILKGRDRILDEDYETRIGRGSGSLDQVGKIRLLILARLVLFVLLIPQYYWRLYIPFVCKKSLRINNSFSAIRHGSFDKIFLGHANYHRFFRIRFWIVPNWGISRGELQFHKTGDGGTATSTVIVSASDTSWTQRYVEKLVTRT